MSRQAAVLHKRVIKGLALSIGALAVTGTIEAQAAASCNAAPKATAPAGSHWYYRVDRGTQRKCWYLAERGQKVRTASLRTNTPAPAEPAVQATSANPERPVKITLVDLQNPLVERFDFAAPRPAPAAQIPNRIAEERKDEPVIVGAPAERESVSEAVARDERKSEASLVHPERGNVAAATESSTARYAFAAVAAISFFASAIFFLIGAGRERSYAPIVDLNTRPPLRRLNLTHARGRHPEPSDTRTEHALMEERLLAFAQTWRKQAA
jgi:hypothetical protein